MSIDRCEALSSQPPLLPPTPVHLINSRNGACPIAVIKCWYRISSLEFCLETSSGIAATMNVFRKSLVFFICFILSVTAAEKKRSSQEMSTGESPIEYIERKVKTHDVMVFARSYGKQNKQAKELLKQISKETTTPVEFLDLDLMEGWDGSLLMLYLEETTGQWALPNIFIGGKHVGGNNEIDQMHALGDLEVMVLQAGQEL